MCPKNFNFIIFYLISLFHRLNAERTTHTSNSSPVVTVKIFITPIFQPSFKSSNYSKTPYKALISIDRNTHNLGRKPVKSNFHPYTSSSKARDNTQYYLSKVNLDFYLVEISESEYTDLQMGSNFTPFFNNLIESFNKIPSGYDCFSNFNGEIFQAKFLYKKIYMDLYFTLKFGEKAYFNIKTLAHTDEEKCVEGDFFSFEHEANIDKDKKHMERKLITEKILRKIFKMRGKIIVNNRIEYNNKNDENNKEILTFTKGKFK